MSIDYKGRDIIALEIAHRRAMRAALEFEKAGERAMKAMDSMFRALSLLDVRELFALHARGR